MLHILAHILAPLVIAIAYSRWNKQGFLTPFLIMLGTMIVDIDHLLANPIYEPNRCSIGLHPLHTVIPIIVYAGLIGFAKTRWVGIGLLLHMALDIMDCWL